MKKTLLLGTLVATLFSGCYNIAEGEKIGQVTKVNKASGFFAKTVEVEIIRGGFNGGSGAQGQALHFTVENKPDTVKLLETAMTNGDEVKVQYHTEFITFLRSDSQNTFGDNVTVIRGTPTAPNGQSVQIDSNDQKQLMLKALKDSNDALINQNKALISIIESEKK